MSSTFTLRVGWIMGAILACAVQARASQDVSDVEGIARILLDDDVAGEERERLIAKHTEFSDRLIAAMVRGLEPGTKEEYRRIPWIWRVSIAAGKRNDLSEMRRILDVSLPRVGEPLDDWRAVVVGGGLVNGVTQAGQWPARRLREILRDDDCLSKQWDWTLARAEAMADDSKVPTGTRYDALRIVGTAPWDRAAGRLLRYLLKGVHPELAMGAVSGLADIETPGAAVSHALLAALDHLSEPNVKLALDGLLRDEPRCLALLDAIGGGRLDAKRLTEEHARALANHPSASVRRRWGEVRAR